MQRVNATNELKVSHAEKDVEAQQQEGTFPRHEMGDHAFSIAYRRFSYYWSTALLIFALIVVFYTVGKGWTNPPWNNTHPAAECFILLLLLSWISMLEGCQISIVGLQNIDMDQYKHTHPRAYKCCKLVHCGPNVERFLVGRQFCLLFCGFVTARVGSFSADNDFYIGDWHWASWASTVFCQNSILLLIVIISPAQLVSQLIAANKMMGYFNLPFGAYYTVCIPCLAIESIGLTHSSYLLKDVLIKISGIDESQADPKKRLPHNFLYYFRVLISISAVIFSGIFIVKGLSLNQTNATNGTGWENLPAWAAIILTFIFLFTMACAEGLQVSALALAKTSTHELKMTKPLAYRTCQTLFTGRNMQAFLIGRQTIVAMMMILLARVTSYSGSDGILEDGGDWGMGKSFNEWLLQTGLLGAVFVCNVAQLASQVAALIFPMPLINNHFMFWLLHIMLAIEASGVMNSCWVLSWNFCSLYGLEADPLDEDVTTIAKNMVERKRSLGYPVSKGVTPFSLNQPEEEFHRSPEVNWK